MTGKIDTTLLPVGKKKKKKLQSEAAVEYFFFYTFFFVNPAGTESAGQFGTYLYVPAS